MKRIGLVLAAVIWTVICAVAAEAAPRLLEIQSKFYGTAMRLVFIFDRPVDALLFQDWEERIIILSVPGLELNPGQVNVPIGAGNFVVSSVKAVSGKSGGYDIAVRTPRDFAAKQVPLTDKRFFTLDVFAPVKSLPAASYVERGKAYEARRHYEKALASYRRALEASPGFDEAYFRAGLVRMNIGDRKRALVNFRNVSSGSRFAGLASKYVKLLGGAEPFRDEESIDATVPGESKGEEGIAAAPGEGSNQKMALTPGGGDGGADAPPSGTNSTSPDGKTAEDQIAANSAPAASSEEISRISPPEPAVADSEGGNAAGDDGGREIPVKYAGWYQVELKETLAADAGASGAENLIDRFFARVGELNSFLSSWWHAIAASGIFLMFFLGFLIYRFWPGRKKSKTGKVSRYLDKELKKELKRRRVLHGVDDSGQAPAFANKLADLYKKTDSSRQEDINRELEKSEIAKDPLLFDEEYEKRGRVVNKILGENESEIVHLTKQFIQKDENKTAGADKYQAVIQLKKKDWPEERIAQELHMGVEEVRLVIDMWRAKNPEIAAEAIPAAGEKSVRQEPQKKTGAPVAAKSPMDIDTLRKRIDSVRG